MSSIDVPKLGDILEARYTYYAHNIDFLPETWTLQGHSLWSVVEVSNLQCRLIKLDKDLNPMDSNNYKNNLTVDTAVIYDIFRRSKRGN